MSLSILYHKGVCRYQCYMTISGGKVMIITTCGKIDDKYSKVPLILSSESSKTPCLLFSIKNVIPRSIPYAISGDIRALKQVQNHYSSLLSDGSMGSTYTIDGKNLRGHHGLVVGIFPSRSLIFMGKMSEHDLITNIVQFREYNNDIFKYSDYGLCMGTYYSP